MRLPGTRYQEHGWEGVRKLLGACSLQAFAQFDCARLATDGAALLPAYVDLTAAALRAAAHSVRARADGNSYGESAGELALSLLFELQARVDDWLALCSAVAGEYARLGRFWERPGGEAILRKKFNDLYALLRDKVDSDNYQVACGRPCSPNKMYAYRMLDTSYAAIGAAFADWDANRELVGAILGREIVAQPIEARQMTSIAACRAEWILAWSAAQERLHGAPGPLHTRSKRFASLKANPEKIAVMLAEIGDYEELSSNRERDWLYDAEEAGEWMADLWRVVADADNPGDDRIAPPHPDEFEVESPQPEDDNTADNSGDDAAPEPSLELQARAAAVSLPLRFLQLARDAEDRASWSARMLADVSLPVRLAVYWNILGPVDDCYPDAWLDPATGELPTMVQLAGLDGVSLPTLRKRRDAAIARLRMAPRNEQ